MKTIDLNLYEIKNKNIYHNPPKALLYEHALKYEKGSYLTNNGSLAVTSGEKTGRCPKHKYIVNDIPVNEIEKFNLQTKKQIIPKKDFEEKHQQAINMFNKAKQIYIIDALSGWEEKYQFKIRIICTRAYHALFSLNIFIPPKKTKTDFQTPDCLVFNAGEYPDSHALKQNKSKTSITLSLHKKEILIFGTEYAGEIKKGIFSLMNYLMPKKQILSMHCSATEGQKKDVTLMFGLSGTGKTTLSADPNRQLIGDDQHCWTNEGIYNMEGGCYAKTIDISPKSEPTIFQAIRYETVLENIVFDPISREIDYHNKSLTENTRATYPIQFIKNAKIPCIGKHPKNIIFLTCDAFGVLPPISKLSYEQAVYHFILGYTAKIVGTEIGITKPETTFSACFGEAFIVWHPIHYANLLAEKIKKYNVNTWLINTGWTGGPCDVGKRVPLKYTRNLLKAIHSDIFSPEQAKKHNIQFKQDEIFNLSLPSNCPNVPSELLNPKNSWKSKTEYDEKAIELAKHFQKQFTKYESQSPSWVLRGAP